jgi:MerR HTH family regulatory protein
MATSAKTTRLTTVKLVRAVPRRRRGLIDADTLASESGLHPELVRRLLRLGLVEAAGGTAQAPLFRPEAAARLARAVRLRRDLGIDYAGAVLASELLARIDELEERLRRAQTRRSQKR